MQKINQKHQRILDQAVFHEIDLSGLRKKYTLKTALSIFKHFLKETENGKKEIYPIYPFNLKKDISIEKFHNDLKDAGFKIKRVIKEPFIDEDTGKIVNIKRTYFRTIK